MTLSVGKSRRPVAGSSVVTTHRGTGSPARGPPPPPRTARPPPPRVLLVRGRDALDLDRHPEPARVERALVLAPARELGHRLERDERDRPDVDRVARAGGSREAHLVAGVGAQRLGE